MAPNAESSDGEEGSVVPSSKTSTCSGQQAEITSRKDQKQSIFTSLSCRPTLQPVLTSPCSSYSSSSSTCFSPASSPCSESRASKSVENSCNSNNISDFSTESDMEEMCTTPKAEESRIPETIPCPPAPRKRRVSSRFRAVPLTGFFHYS